MISFSFSAFWSFREGCRELGGKLRVGGRPGSWVLKLLFDASRPEYYSGRRTERWARGTLRRAFQFWPF
jgi:hypothetical protein